MTERQPYYIHKGKFNETVDLIKRKREIQNRLLLIRHDLRSATGEDRKDLKEEQEKLTEELSELLRQLPAKSRK